METKHKVFYEAPWTEVLELKTESSLLTTSDYKFGGQDEDVPSFLFF